MNVLFLTAPTLNVFAKKRAQEISLESAIVAGFLESNGHTVQHHDQFKDAVHTHVPFGRFYKQNLADRTER